MVIDLFSKILKNPSILPNPWVKTNKLFADNLEKMLKFQMNALKSYLDIGLNQMRAAAEITDMHSFQDFCKRQAQIAQTVQYKMLNDVKALSDMNAGFKSEMDTLNQATLQDAFSKAA